MTSETPADPLIGTIVSERYRVLERIGRGGFGAVYRVQHVRLDKILALKVLFEHAHQNPRMIKRFEREARATCRIGHENIVEITDFARDRSIGYYFVMELLEGETLGERLTKLGPMSAARVVHIGKQMADALAATHTKGIVHRDLKPENIFLTSKPGRDDFVKVVDFGIAAMVDFDEHEPRLTNHGTMLGTPSYMSPEQARGKRAGHRSDIYSFGIILYELVTGKVPFRNNEPMVVLEMHRSTSPIPPTSFRPDLDIPAELESIIMRALRKSTAQRYQSMREIFNDLDALGSKLDMTTLETSGRRVDNEGHRAAEQHEREEPEWLDEDLLLVDQKPAEPVTPPALSLDEIGTSMPMPIDPATSEQAATIPMDRPQISEELPISHSFEGGNTDLNVASADLQPSFSPPVLPKAKPSKPSRVGIKSPWERTAKSAHLEPVPKLPASLPRSPPTRPVESAVRPRRFWHYPVVMMLLGFLATFTAYVFFYGGFSSVEHSDSAPVEASPGTAAVQSSTESLPSPPGTEAAASTPTPRIGKSGSVAARIPSPSGGANSGTIAQRKAVPASAESLPLLMKRLEATSSARLRRTTEEILSTVWLRLQSIPSGASIFIEGELVGTTPADVSLPRADVTRSIKFEKDGVTKRKAVLLMHDQVLTVRLLKSSKGRVESGGANYDLY